MLGFILVIVLFILLTVFGLFLIDRLIDFLRKSGYRGRF